MEQPRSLAKPVLLRSLAKPTLPRILAPRSPPWPSQQCIYLEPLKSNAHLSTASRKQACVKAYSERILLRHVQATAQPNQRKHGSPLKPLLDVSSLKGVVSSKGSTLCTSFRVVTAGQQGGHHLDESEAWTSELFSSLEGSPFLKQVPLFRFWHIHGCVFVQVNFCLVCF